MRIPSWLGAEGQLHSEAVYIGADRFRYRTVSLAIKATIHTPSATRQVENQKDLRHSQYALMYLVFC